MKIKISPDNAEKIEKILIETCGNGQYVYDDFDDLVAICNRFEKKMDILGLAPSMRGGAIVEDISGCSVANAYKYSRKATKVNLLRGERDWFLIGVWVQMIGTNGGNSRLYLTEKQDERILSKVRSQYRVV